MRKRGRKRDRVCKNAHFYWAKGFTFHPFVCINVHVSQLYKAAWSKFFCASAAKEKKVFHHNGGIGIVEALCMFAAATCLAIRTGSCHKSLKAPPQQATVRTESADPMWTLPFLPCRATLRTSAVFV